MLENIPLKDFKNGALLNVLETKGYFSLTSDGEVNTKTKRVFGIMLNLYLTNERTANLSIVVNFVTKVLLWYGEYGKQICKTSQYNPKILYWGSPKIHEIYFLILLSLMGCDILVLNTSFDDKFEKIDKDMDFCLLIKEGHECPIGAFPTNQGENKSLTGQETSLIKSIVSTETNLHVNNTDLFQTGPSMMIKLKKAESIFVDILVPLSARSGYVGGPYPILPLYFVRYVGVPSSTDEWETEYFNSLYNHDKKLQTWDSYLKFHQGIPAVSAQESSSIPPSLINHPYKTSREIIEQILQADILPRMNDDLLDNTIRNAFIEVVTLFAEKSSSTNTSIIHNFSIKLVTWLNRYLPKLFAQCSRNKNNGASGFNYEHNPKILFYGMIKPQEIYLLIVFHRIGCDVLFVHSDEEGDKPFQMIDNEGQFSQLIKNNRSLPISSFPEEERMVRKSTIAYNASKEIEEVIYSEEVGLFKPWQFEDYSTLPITLKTTYDELKILWREPAKLRPEFKVQNKKVYVPNLFAKINGVSEDIETYWQDIKAFSSAPNTKLIENVPFSKVCYTKQELFQADFLLNKQGLFDELKVGKSSHYKFGYLKADLQHFLIAKINELICSGVFLAPVDEKFKLKILMTILTMDDSLLKLIEVFDFPQEIPKVIVYDSTRETISEEDAILLGYFNLIGLDVVLFTPTSYKTIEQQIKPSLFDVYKLPYVKYDLVLPSLVTIPETSTLKPGLFARIFNSH